MHYTDYEAALVYLAAIQRNLKAPSYELRKELDGYPALRPVVERHGTGSVAMRLTDFRTAVRTDLKPTRGARLPQVRRIIADLECVTGMSLREDLLPEAA